MMLMRTMMTKITAIISEKGLACIELNSWLFIVQELSMRFPCGILHINKFFVLFNTHVSISLLHSGPIF